MHDWTGPCEKNGIRQIMQTQNKAQRSGNCTEDGFFLYASFLKKHRTHNRTLDFCAATTVSSTGMSLCTYVDEPKCIDQYARWYCATKRCTRDEGRPLGGN